MCQNTTAVYCSDMCQTLLPYTVVNINKITPLQERIPYHRLSLGNVSVCIFPIVQRLSSRHSLGSEGVWYVTNSITCRTVNIELKLIDLQRESQTESCAVQSAVFSIAPTPHRYVHAGEPERRTLHFCEAVSKISP